MDDFISCIIPTIALNIVSRPPEGIHPLHHYARGVAVASCQRQPLLRRVKVQPFPLFRDFLHLNYVWSATKSHQQQFAFTASLHLQMLAVAALPAALQTSSGMLRGSTSHLPEDKTAAITLTSWQLSDRGTDSVIICRKA